MTEIVRDFLYLRHGQTDWNAEGRMQGATDIPLNAVGRAQAAEAAARLTDTRIDRIVASPMARAAETAAIVGAAKGLTVDHDDRLKERYFGAFDGMTLSDIRAHHGVGDGVSIWSLDSPEAEPFDQALSRTRAAISDHLAGRDDHVLFVAHGALFTLLVEDLLGLRVASANATPYRLSRPENAWRLDEI